MGYWLFTERCATITEDQAVLKLYQFTGKERNLEGAHIARKESGFLGYGVHLQAIYVYLIPAF